MQNAYAPQRQQYGQQQYGSQGNAQAQSSPFRTPDMSLYAQPQGGYNAYNVPRTPPQGARVNDLSGSVPSNLIYGQAYNQAAQQYNAGNTATSFTMPGTYVSQSYDPTTGSYTMPTGGESWAGNMAYNPIDNRPSPVTAYSTFAGGQPMPFQQALNQRMAFAGNLSNRLNQYAGGQLSGPVTVDQQALLRQANQQLANGSFVNPFAAQQPDARPFTESPYAQNPGNFSPAVHQAMTNATQYMQGSQPWDNPFGNAYNNQKPSWGQQSYSPVVGRTEAEHPQIYLGSNPVGTPPTVPVFASSTAQSPPINSGKYPWKMSASAARSIPPTSTGDVYPGTAEISRKPSVTAASVPRYHPSNVGPSMGFGNKRYTRQAGNSRVTR